MQRANRGLRETQGFHHFTNSSKGYGRGKRLVALAIAPVAAALWVSSAHAQTLTWDSGGASFGAPVDGPGNWDTTSSASWSNGSGDSAWSSGNAAVFGNGGTPGTVTIDDSSGGVSATGLTFNNTTGDYTIAGETLTLAGAAPIISVATGQSPTISSAIAGTGGVTLNATGATLNISSTNNSYTGTTAINSGTIVVSAGSSLGNTTNSVAIGTPFANTLAFTAIGNLTYNSNQTIGSLTCATNTSTASTGNNLTIASGTTLTIMSTGSPPSSGLNAAVAIGNNTQITDSGTIDSKQNCALAMTGGGSLYVNGTATNASFMAGMGDTSNGGAGGSAISMGGTLDMSGLTNFTFVTGTGAAPAYNPSNGNPAVVGGNEFGVGVGISTNFTVVLAANNSITAGTIDIGDTQPTPGSTVPLGVGLAGSSTDTLILGSGTNTLDANNILIGIGRNNSVILWNTTTATGTLTIAGAVGGTSTANITIGEPNAGTPATSASVLNLSGHTVSVQAGTVILGDLLNAGAGKAASTPGGSIAFDTGTFTVANLEMGLSSSANTTSADLIQGAFTEATGSGVLNVTNSLILGDWTGGAGAGDVDTLTVRGGTANVGANIVSDSVISGTKTSTSTLAISNSGVLNMEGFAIGPITAVGNTGAVGVRHIGTVTEGGGTLENLGGTGINDAGLVVAGGSLTLAGTNTYSNGTTIGSGGMLQLGGASVLPTGTIINFTSTGTATAILDLNGNNFPTLGFNVVSGGVNVIGSNNTGTNGILNFAGPGNSTFSGIVQDRATAVTGTHSTAVEVTGGETITLSGANGYAGGTSITSGTLKVGSSGALGGAFTQGVNNSNLPGSTNVSGTGVLDLNGITISEPLTLSGGTLTNGSGSAAVLDSGVKGVGFSTLAGTAGVGGSSTISFSGGSAVATPNLGVTPASFAISGGSSYAKAPSITISGGGGIGATATATLTNGVVTSITITNPGSGYTSAPNIAFSGTTTAGGTLATGTGNPDDFEIVSILQTSAGTGYSTAPTATFTNTSAAATPAVVTLTPVASSVNLAATSSIGGTAGNMTINAPISGVGNLNKTGTNTLTLGGVNSYAGTTIAGGTLVAAASGALPTNAPVTDNGTLKVINATTNTTGQITGTGSLIVGDGTHAATLQLAPGSGASAVNSLTVAAGSNLDLTTNGITINYGSAGNQGTTDTTILSYLSGASYSQAPQTGTKLISSSLATNTQYAIGEVDGNDSVSGTPVAANTLEIAYTLQGDLNLDGVVNGTDFSILVTHFGQPLTGIGWEQGDITGDGIVNGTDFSALVTNFGAFNNSTAGLSEGTGGGLVTVPEPATTGLMVFAGLGLLSRRKRRGEVS